MLLLGYGLIGFADLAILSIVARKVKLIVAKIIRLKG
jgi:hypothetical protein